MTIEIKDYVAVDPDTGSIIASDTEFAAVRESVARHMEESGRHNVTMKACIFKLVESIEAEVVVRPVMRILNQSKPAVQSSSKAHPSARFADTKNMILQVLKEHHDGGMADDVLKLLHAKFGESASHVGSIRVTLGRMHKESLIVRDPVTNFWKLPS